MTAPRRSSFPLVDLRDPTIVQIKSNVRKLIDFMGYARRKFGQYEATMRGLEERIGVLERDAQPVSAPEEPALPPPSMEVQVEALLEDLGPSWMTPNSLATTLGADGHEVYRALMRLERQGRVLKYKEAGRHALWARPGTATPAECRGTA